MRGFVMESLHSAGRVATVSSNALRRRVPTAARRRVSTVAVILAMIGGLFAMNSTAGAGPSLVAVAALHASDGYLVVDSDGGVDAYDGAQWRGDLAGRALVAPIVDVAVTPDDAGYWLVAADGGVFTFGSAAFFGSMGGWALNQPVVGVTATPTGAGYWLAAADGGVFAFGDADFRGSMGGSRLNRPVVGLASSPTGDGYWLAAADGGVFSYGDASFYGSGPQFGLRDGVLDIDATASGYRMVADDGGMFSFGDAGFFGSGLDVGLGQTVALATTRHGGYLLLGRTGVVQQYAPGVTPTRTPAVADPSDPTPNGTTPTTAPPAGSGNPPAGDASGYVGGLGSGWASAPAGAVSVSPGQSIQAAVNSYPEGTAFLLRSGVHSGQSVRPRNGQGFYGESGTVLSGANSAQYAFYGAASNVVIAGLEIRDYATPLQNGAIHAMDNSTPSNGWLIEGVNVHDNAAGGVFVGSNSLLRNSRIHHNGQIGLKSASTTNAVIDNVEVDNNNTDNHNAGWEAGGSKFAYTTNLVVRNSFVHHNAGPGLWTDIDNVNTLYEANVVSDNMGAGIFHEISYSAIIRNNVIERNGYYDSGWLWGAGIQVAASPDTEVYGNSLKDNENGIVGIQQNRGSDWILRNYWVHDNTIENSGITGLAQDISDTSIYTSRNNRFDRNTYINQPYWQWNDTPLSSFGAWQSYGQDRNGSAR